MAADRSRETGRLEWIQGDAPDAERGQADSEIGVRAGSAPPRREAGRFPWSSGGWSADSDSAGRLLLRLN